MFPELPGQKWIWITLVLAVSIPAIAQVDSTAATHLGKGYEALKQDRYDAAVEEFRAALQQDPKLTLRARFPLAVALFELKRFDEAGKELQTVQRETGEHPNVLYYLGRIDLEQRNFADAVANLRKAAAQPPFPVLSWKAPEPLVVRTARSWPTALLKRSKSFRYSGTCAGWMVRSVYLCSSRDGMPTPQTSGNARRRPSVSPKKNSLSRTMRPPAAAAYWLET